MGDNSRNTQGQSNLGNNQSNATRQAGSTGSNPPGGQKSSIGSTNQNPNQNQANKTGAGQKPKTSKTDDSSEEE